MKLSIKSLRRLLRESITESAVEKIEQLPPVFPNANPASYKASFVSVEPMLVFSGTPGEEFDQEKFDLHKQLKADSKNVSTFGIHDVLATQAWVDRRKLIRYASDWKDAGTMGPPHVMVLDGRNYLIDGHHRVVVMALMGRNSFTASWVSADD